MGYPQLFSDYHLYRLLSLYIFQILYTKIPKEYARTLASGTDTFDLDIVNKDDIYVVGKFSLL